MPSPWNKLKPSPPYVLQSDKIYVSTFNQRLAIYNKDRDPKQQRLSKINTGLYPQVFSGRFDAPIILLLQNPSADGDATNPTQAIHQIASNNRGKAKRHFYLSIQDPWWIRVFNRGVNQAAAALHLDSSLVWSRLTDRLLSIEYFPYWSRTFGQASLRLPSQQFTFDMVKRAIRRNAAIILPRARELWFGAVPELNGYENLILPVKPRQRNVYVSRQVYGAEQFQSFIDYLK